MKISILVILPVVPQFPLQKRNRGFIRVSWYWCVLLVLLPVLSCVLLCACRFLLVILCARLVQCTSSEQILKYFAVFGNRTEPVPDEDGEIGAGSLRYVFQDFRD